MPNKNEFVIELPEQFTKKDLHNVLDKEFVTRLQAALTTSNTIALEAHKILSTDPKLKKSAKKTAKKK